MLYGARMTGLTTAALMLASNIDFYGFCSRGAERFPNGIMGKPVLSPDYLYQNPDDTLVVITAQNMYSGYNEILDCLKDHNFPLNQIISYRDSYQFDGTIEQYFEFPQLYPRGTAFLDCGCGDGANSLSFAKWCQEDYSKIYVFEPDPDNFVQCESILRNAGIQNLEFFNCGLSDTSSFVRFFADSSGSSCIYPEDEIQTTYMQKTDFMSQADKIKMIKTVRIDDVVGEDTVGFIKMDIEGSELSALRGGCGTIMRDKPLLAISIYHKPGDVLEIIDYCRQLVPEYKFWLRQYEAINETVMYASVMETTA